jgi:hypothetical protein
MKNLLIRLFYATMKRMKEKTRNKGINSCEINKLLRLKKVS